jgi:hypothetical protein
MNRRNFIIGAGGTLALVAAAGTWRVTRMPKTAILPWGLDPEPLTDVRLDAFRHAILAPNPHNRQPWLIRLDGTDSAVLTCDLDKRLPETDPFDRQITIGFGTFIELARIAAAERGVRMDVEPFPEGEPEPRLDGRPVARLSFTPAREVKRDPLFTAIMARRTNREVYDARPPRPAQLARLTAEHVNASTDAALMQQLRSITVAAITREMTTQDKLMESVRLMRIGHDEIDANPDGIPLSGPMIEATAALGLTSHQSLADQKSSASKIGLDGLTRIYGSVPAAVWIVTPGNSRAEQLEAGRLYARANLGATALGLAMHPMSQALQEYSEMTPHFAAVHQLLGVSGGARLQMLARLGHAPAVDPAPRWPVERHIVS